MSRDFFGNIVLSMGMLVATALLISLLRLRFGWELEQWQLFLLTAAVALFFGGLFHGAVFLLRRAQRGKLRR